MKKQTLRSGFVKIKDYADKELLLNENFEIGTISRFRFFTPTNKYERGSDGKYCNKEIQARWEEWQALAKGK